VADSPIGGVLSALSSERPGVVLDFLNPPTTIGWGKSQRIEKGWRVFASALLRSLLLTARTPDSNIALQTGWTPANPAAIPAATGTAARVTSEVAVAGGANRRAGVAAGATAKVAGISIRVTR
jgi:hypothetical protein